MQNPLHLRVEHSKREMPMWEKALFLAIKHGGDLPVLSCAGLTEQNNFRTEISNNWPELARYP